MIHQQIACLDRENRISNRRARRLLSIRSRICDHTYPALWQALRDPDHCTSPEGWQYRGPDSQTMLGFVLHGTPTPPPGVNLVPQVQLLVTSHLAREVTVPKERLEDPKYSLTATWMEGGTPIEEFRKVESIDAGPYGTLPLWLIRGGAYSYYLVIIQREGV